MPAKDLGIKYACFKCDTKFYNLKKPEPLCPKCGADQRKSPAQKAPSPVEKRNRAVARLVVAPEKDDVELDSELELDDEFDGTSNDSALGTDPDDG